MFDFAKKVLASQGRPVNWVNGMTGDEITELTTMLDAEGNVKLDTPQLFAKFLTRYHDRLKAVVETELESEDYDGS